MNVNNNKNLILVITITYILIFPTTSYVCHCINRNSVFRVTHHNRVNIDKHNMNEGNTQFEIPTLIKNAKTCKLIIMSART